MIGTIKSDKFPGLSEDLLSEVLRASRSLRSGSLLEKSSSEQLPTLDVDLVKGIDIEPIFKPQRKNLFATKYAIKAI